MIHCWIPLLNLLLSYRCFFLCFLTIFFLSFSLISQEQQINCISYSVVWHCCLFWIIWIPSTSFFTPMIKQHVWNCFIPCLSDQKNGRPSWFCGSFECPCLTNVIPSFEVTWSGWDNDKKIVMLHTRSPGYIQNMPVLANILGCSLAEIT